MTNQCPRIGWSPGLVYVFPTPGSLFFIQMQEDEIPTALGFYRDMGHSQIVFFMCELIGSEWLDHLIVLLTNRGSQMNI